MRGFGGVEIIGGVNKALGNLGHGRMDWTLSTYVDADEL